MKWSHLLCHKIYLLQNLFLVSKIKNENETENDLEHEKKLSQSIFNENKIGDTKKLKAVLFWLGASLNIIINWSVAPGAKNNARTSMTAR